MSDKKGWIKIYRELLDKPIWQLSSMQQKVILITLLLMANHEPKKWEWQGKQYECEAGQFITSIAKIKEKCGIDISSQNVRTALKRFEKLDFLTRQSTKTSSLITIVNWESYQGYYDEGNKGSNNDLTKTSQSPNKGLTTNKNDKELKNNKELKKDNNISCAPEPHETDSLEDFYESIWSLYPIKKGKGQVSKTKKQALQRVGYDEIKRCVERFILDMGEKDKQYWMHGSTFFGGGYVDYLDKNYTDVATEPEEKKPVDEDRFSGLDPDFRQQLEKRGIINGNSFSRKDATDDEIKILQEAGAL